MINASFIFWPAKYVRNNIIVDRFRSLWNNYQESDKKFLSGEVIEQKPLHEHLSSDGPQII